jgi:hypothetical protein
MSALWTVTEAIGGPATFGEVAYILLNQTLVYLASDRLAA